MEITHLTSVHPRHDARIFHKECLSLVRAGYGVCLIVADGMGDETKEGVRIYDVGAPNSRLDRLFRSTLRVFKKARELGADIYHFHDSELLPMALLLQGMGCKVVYDVHEDVRSDLISRHYLPKPLLKLLGRIVECLELFVARRAAAVVAVIEPIAERFSAINPRTELVRNFPIVSEPSPKDVPWESREMAVAYAGALDLSRGIKEMVSAMGLIPEDERATLKLAGAFAPSKHRDAVVHLSGWARVEEMGLLNRAEVALLLERVRAGLVVLLPYPNFLKALATKMFEYMSAGIPVIASDFPLWQKIIVDNECGLLVDPESPSAIADAIRWVLNNPQEAENMGRRGREAVLKFYNWEAESKRLLSLYESLSRSRADKKLDPQVRHSGS